MTDKDAQKKRQEELAAKYRQAQEQLTKRQIEQLNRINRQREEKQKKNNTTNQKDSQAKRNSQAKEELAARYRQEEEDLKRKQEEAERFQMNSLGFGGIAPRFGTSPYSGAQRMIGNISTFSQIITYNTEYNNAKTELQSYDTKQLEELSQIFAEKSIIPETQNVTMSLNKDNISNVCEYGTEYLKKTGLCGTNEKYMDAKMQKLFNNFTHNELNDYIMHFDKMSSEQIQILKADLGLKEDFDLKKEHLIVLNSTRDTFKFRIASQKKSVARRSTARLVNRVTPLSSGELSRITYRTKQGTKAVKVIVKGASKSMKPIVVGGAKIAKVQVRKFGETDLGSQIKAARKRGKQKAEEKYKLKQQKKKELKWQKQNQRNVRQRQKIENNPRLQKKQQKKKEKNLKQQNKHERKLVKWQRKTDKKAVKAKRKLVKKEKIKNRRIKINKCIYKINRIMHPVQTISDMLKKAILKKIAALCSPALPFLQLVGGVVLVVIMIFILVIGSCSIIASLLPNAKDRKADTMDTYIQLIYDNQKEMIEQVAQTASDATSGNVSLHYYTQDEKGKWVKSTTGYSNAKQIISMGATILDFEKKYKEDEERREAEEKGEKYEPDDEEGWSIDEAQRFGKYVGKLASQAMKCTIRRGDTSYCAGDCQYPTDDSEDAKKCKGHSEIEMNIYLYTFPIDNPDNKKDKKTNIVDQIMSMSDSLFKTDNSFGCYEELITDVTKKILKEENKDGDEIEEEEPEEEINIQTVTKKVYKKVGLTCYSAKNDECQDKWTAKHQSSSGRKLVCDPENGVVSTAIDPKYWGIKSLKDEIMYFTMDGFTKKNGQPVIFRADDVGGGVKGAHIDIFTEDYNVPVPMGKYTVRGNYPAGGATVRILDTSQLSDEALEQLARSTGKHYEYWTDERVGLAIAKASTDWKELYEIELDDFSLPKYVSISANTNTAVNQSFNEDTKSWNKSKNLHAISIEKEEKENESEASPTIITKEYQDEYVNKILYSLVKWACSRNNTSVYSQARRGEIAKRNPSKNCGSDCTAFATWVYQRTFDELKIPKNSMLQDKQDLYNWFGKYTWAPTTDTYKAEVNIRKSGDLLPGDILIRGITDKYHSSAGGNGGSNNHAGIFLGFTKNGYRYIDCTTNSGGKEPAIKIKNINTKQVISSSGEGSSSSGSWGGAVRIFDYNTLNLQLTNTKQANPDNEMLFTTKELKEAIQKEKKCVYPNGFNKNSLITKEEYMWRKYKKYGGKNFDWVDIIPDYGT